MTLKTTEIVSKERSTRRGEIIFVAVAIAFWIVVSGFLWQVLSNSFRTQGITSGFWVFTGLGVFGVFMVVIGLWLGLLALAEAESLTRTDSVIDVVYFHLGERRLTTPPVTIRKFPVRLFRFNLERGFEPAWLLYLGRQRMAVISRDRFIE